MIIVFLIFGIFSLIYAVKTLVNKRKCKEESTALGVAIGFFAALALIYLTIGITGVVIHCIE